jgi:hypothetical protein
VSFYRVEEIIPSLRPSEFNSSDLSFSSLKHPSPGLPSHSTYLLRSVVEKCVRNRLHQGWRVFEVEAYLSDRWKLWKFGVETFHTKPFSLLPLIHPKNNLQPFMYSFCSYISSSFLPLAIIIRSNYHCFKPQVQLITTK